MEHKSWSGATFQCATLPAWYLCSTGKKPSMLCIPCIKITFLQMIFSVSGQFLVLVILPTQPAVCSV